SRGDRHRYAARNPRGAGSQHSAPGRGVQAPHAPAGRQRLGTARRARGLSVSMPRPAALLAWSGGKDAAWALHTLRQRGEVDVVGLLSTISAGDERASMQGIGVDVLRAQAAAAGLPLLEMRIAD